MKQKKENRTPTLSTSYRMNEKEKQSEIVPITHTFYYEKTGDSLSPLSSVRKIDPCDGYESDSDLFTLIEEIQNEFEVVKLDFDRINQNQVKSDDESECSSTDNKDIRTTNSTITTLTGTTTPSTITSIKRSPSYEQIFENFFSSYEECFDNANDEDEIESQEINTFFRNNSPRSIFFDMELLTSTKYKNNDDSIFSKSCSNQRYLKQDSTLLSSDGHHLQMDGHKNTKNQIQQYRPQTLRLQLRAHKLKKKKRKKRIKNIIGKKKPSTYFEIYCGNREQSFATQVSSGWDLLHRSYPIMKDSNPCWELPCIDLQKSQHRFSNEMSMKITLFNIDRHGNNKLIGSSFTTLGYMLSGLPLSQLFLTKKGKCTGSISIQATLN